MSLKSISVQGAAQYRCCTVILPSVTESNPAREHLIQSFTFRSGLLRQHLHTGDPRQFHLKMTLPIEEKIPEWRGR
jgi:hypothetical protein